MVAEGECERSKTDAGAWWSLIALAEAALSRFPEGTRHEGYELVNKNVDRELVEKARRDEAEQAAKRVVGIIFCPKEARHAEHHDPVGERPRALQAVDHQGRRGRVQFRSAWTARTPSR